MYGPTGITVGVAAGLLRVLYCHPENRAELVPVDMCVNSLIASAYDVGVNTYDEPPVYNFVVSPENALTWKSYCQLSMNHGIKYPFNKMAWYYSLTLSPSKAYIALLTYLYHLIPASIVDLCFFLLGRKPR